jgi:hypothetical protein
MLAGVASAVRYAVSLGRLHTGGSQPVWGDGFANGSLSTLWYSRSWSDVSDDELALFLPCLTDRDDPDFGVAARVRAAFIRRLRASRLISPRCQAASSSFMLVSPENALAEEMRKLPTREERAIADRLGPDRERPDWAREASILQAMDDMYRRACGEDIDPPALAGALMASIHTGINAAYVFPSCAFAHELLATGAWFGMLLMGRRVMMPPYVAEVLLGHLGGAREDKTSEVLQFHVAHLGGTAYFLRHARNVIGSGNATPIDYVPPRL